MKLIISLSAAIFLSACTAPKEENPEQLWLETTKKEGYCVQDNEGFTSCFPPNL